VVAVKHLLLNQSVDSILDTPPDILVGARLDHVHRLCESCDVIGVSCFSCFTKTVLEMSQKLINFILCVLLVNSESLWSKLGKHVDSIDQVITFEIKSVLVVHHDLSHLLIQIFILFSSETLHDMVELTGRALWQFFQHRTQQNSV